MFHIKKMLKNRKVMTLITTLTSNRLFILLFAFTFLLSTFASAQQFDVNGTAKAGSYHMGAVKMLPAGAGFRSIRFENDSEILAEFNSSNGSPGTLGYNPPSLNIGQVKIGNLRWENLPGNADGFWVRNGNYSLFSVSLTDASLLTDHLSIWGSLMTHEHTIRSKENGSIYWKLSTSARFNSLDLSYKGTQKGSFSSLNGAYNTFSDRRLKAGIKDLDAVLPGVLQLKPKSYLFKDAMDADRSIGFIAQEVAETFPSLVYVDPDPEQLLSLNYADFGVLAIKAIQELQEVVNALTKRVQELEELASKDQKMSGMRASVKK